MRSLSVNTFLVLLLASFPTFSASSGQVTGFEADSVSYREGQEPTGKVRVVVGPEGHRLEGVPPRGITLISPADQDNRWMVDPQRKQYAVDNTVGKGERLGGVLSHEACLGFPQSRKLGMVTWRGREVEKWRCEHPAFGRATQWFDPRLGTVIRDRTSKGKIQELRNIRLREAPPATFRFEAREGFEQVPVIELFRQAR